MTVVQYTKNLRGQASQKKDFPKEFLKYLYEDIKNNPINWDGDEIKDEKKDVKEENVQEKSSERLLQEKRIKEYRKKAFLLRKMVRKVQVCLRKVTPYTQTLFPVNDGNIIKPMIESTSKGFRDAIAFCGMTQNTNILKKCIDGFSDMLIIAQKMQLSMQYVVERDLKQHKISLDTIYIKAAIISSQPKLLGKKYRNLKLYPNSLVANKLVEWLQENKYANSDEDAIAIGNNLKGCGLVCSVFGENSKFANNKLLYHFSEDE